MYSQAPIITIDIQPLIRALEREILTVVDNTKNKDIIAYINASIIFFITKLPSDKPLWSVCDEMMRNRDTMENITIFNQNYGNAIHQFLTLNVPYFFPIDNYYDVINKRRLNLSREDNVLYIRSIHPEEWMMNVSNPYYSITKDLDAYIPERQRIH